jgi:predicted metal-dependent peptidase
MQQAMVVARSSHSQGSIPAGMQRELGALTQAQLDWRSYLWRYLVRTPMDFTGFDRRFMGRKLYLEALEGESVQVFVAIDTSGSVGDAEMQWFLSEVRGILSAYPHLNGELYYADAEAYGPYFLTHNTEIPRPVGGGGTSFVPFFEKVNANQDWYTTGVCVYLTDGYGTFPEEPPTLPVLWIVTPGGLDLAQFPFGEAVRLLSVSV